MRLRGPLVTIGTHGLAVLAVRLVAVWTSVGRAHSTSRTVLGTTIKVNSAVTFAAPPSDSMPVLTAEQVAGPRSSR